MWTHKIIGLLFLLGLASPKSALFEENETEIGEFGGALVSKALQVDEEATQIRMKRSWDWSKIARGARVAILGLKTACNIATPIIGVVETFDLNGNWRELNETKEQIKVTQAQMRCLKDELLARKRRMTETLLTFREAQQKANMMFAQLRKLTNFNQKELDVFKKGDAKELQRLGEQILQVNTFDNLDIHQFTIHQTGLLETGIDSVVAIASIVSFSKEIKSLAAKKLATERKNDNWDYALAGFDVLGNVGNIIQDSWEIHNGRGNAWKIAGITFSILDIGETVVDQLNVVSEDVETALKLIDDAWDVIKCVKGNVDRVNRSKENVEQAKEALQQVKNALDQLKLSGNALDQFLDETDRKVARLTDFANQMYEVLQPDVTTRCLANNATIVSDIMEITDVLKIVAKSHNENEKLIENMDIELKALEIKKRELDEEEKTARSFEDKKVVQTLLKITRGKRENLMQKVKNSLMERHTKMDEEVLVEKMMVHFNLTEEKWTNWTKVDDESMMGCVCSRRTPNCPVSYARDCLTQNCLGPAAKEINKCEKKKKLPHMLQKCRTRDPSYTGVCLTETNQTVETGDVSGYYVSYGGNEGDCYSACKEVAGALGCQYRRMDCPGSRLSCRGKCFVFTEKVKPNNNGIHDTICYEFNQKTPGFAVVPMVRRIFDATNAMIEQGRGEYDSVSYNEKIITLMKVDPFLMESQENAWKAMLDYTNSGEWGKYQSPYDGETESTLEVFDIASGKTNPTIYEPCNFASNWAYYQLAVATTRLPDLARLNPAASKALVQTSAGLAFSSAFFHGSHTTLGNLLDNHMIKILAFILHQTHLQTSNINDTVLMELKPQGKRSMTGVEMAESMTQMFRTKPITEWTDHVNRMDVPSYEMTFAVFILTNMQQFEKTGDFYDWLTGWILSKDIGFTDDEKTFINTLRTKISKLEKSFADYDNFLAAVLKLGSAFAYQQSMQSVSEGHLKIFAFFYEALNSWKRVAAVGDTFLERLNAVIDLGKTQYMVGANPFMEENQCSAHWINQTEEYFPGQSRCDNSGPDHSKWHAQSAIGLFEMFKFENDFIFNARLNGDIKLPLDLDHVLDVTQTVVDSVDFEELSDILG